MTNLKKYPCCFATKESKTTHYYRFHQQTTSVYFPDNDNISIEITRNRATMKFHCPRCDESYEIAKRLKTHAIMGCGQADQTGRQKVNESSELMEDVSSDVKPRRGIRRSRLNRASGTGLTRTQRAIARSCYDTNWNVEKIADYLGCTSREVRSASRNEANDVLDLDSMYLDGQIGDVINIDESPDEEKEPSTPRNRGSHIAARAASSLPRARYRERARALVTESSPMSMRQQCQMSGNENNAPQAVKKSGFRPASSFAMQLTGSHQTRLLAPAFKPIPAVTTPFHATTSPSKSSSPSGTFGNTDSPPPNQRLNSVASSSTFGKSAVTSVGDPIVLKCPIQDFLSGLTIPCAQHRDLFHRLGIRTDEDLDRLSLMYEESEGMVKNDLMSEGITLVEWWSIKRGLEKRVGGNVSVSK